MSDLVRTGSPASIDLVGRVPDRLIARWLARKSEHTRRAYGRDLADFGKFLKVATPDEAARHLLGLAPGDANGVVIDFCEALRQRGRASATINRKLAAIRSLVSLGRVLGIVTWELEVSAERVQPYRDTKGPGTEGVRALLSAAASTKNPLKRLRDLALLRLLWSLALRRSEVCSLDVEHLDREHGRIFVLRKAKTERIWLSAPTPTMEAVAAYLVARGNPEGGPLFLNVDRTKKGGRRLTPSGLHAIVGRLGERAGLLKKVTPHKIRHASITRALDATAGDVRKARFFSGHARLETLLIYDDNREDLAGEVASLVSAALDGEGLHGQPGEVAGESSHYREHDPGSSDPPEEAGRCGSETRRRRAR